MMVAGLSAVAALSATESPFNWAEPAWPETLMLAAAGLAAGGLSGVIADRFWPVRVADAPVRAGRTAPMVGAGVTAVLFVVLAHAAPLGAGLVAWLFYTASGVLLSIVDLRHRLLPNAALLPVFVISAGLLAVTVALSGDWGAFVRALAGAAVLFAVYLALALISPAGMGMGDVKFAAVVGLFLGFQGWPALLIGALAGFIIGALAALATLLVRRGSTVPFGPAMFAGSVVAVLWADIAESVF
jgi:leader peptidase (prepilin peptidase)/N-methyltransferase